MAEPEQAAPGGIETQPAPPSVREQVRFCLRHALSLDRQDNQMGIHLLQNLDTGTLDVDALHSLIEDFHTEVASGNADEALNIARNLARQYNIPIDSIEQSLRADRNASFTSGSSAVTRSLVHREPSGTRHSQESGGNSAATQALTSRGPRGIQRNQESDGNTLDLGALSQGFANLDLINEDIRDEYGTATDGTVLAWNYAGATGFQVFVAYENNGAVTARLEPGRFHSFNKDTLPQMTSTKRGRLRTDRTEEYYFQRGDILGIGLVAPYIDENSEEDPVGALAPGPRGTVYPKVVVEVLYRDGHIGYEPKGNLSQLLRKSESEVNKVIHLMFRKQEENYQNQIALGGNLLEERPDNTYWRNTERQYNQLRQALRWQGIAPYQEPVSWDQQLLQRWPPEQSSFAPQQQLLGRPAPAQQRSGWRQPPMQQQAPTTALDLQQQLLNVLQQIEAQQPSQTPQPPQATSRAPASRQQILNRLQRLGAQQSSQSPQPRRATSGAPDSSQQVANILQQLGARQSSRSQQPRNQRRVETLSASLSPLETRRLLLEGSQATPQPTDPFDMRASSGRAAGRAQHSGNRGAQASSSSSRVPGQPEQSGGRTDERQPTSRPT
ncbi:predicted protein [Coccidioides posadasii str. Silveira]|uniref:Predicted protein n=2 Tax=Coccidioides posadasii (strain RMSCC 757 / Silveira) TaxID=443226 RepID=E9D541_COCPS|nr:predicted protein [Coccidioides posadasii str. Silveira]